MKFAVTVLMSLMFSTCALANTLQSDVEHYIQIFQGDTAQQPAAADTLPWMGLSDPRLFDLIEKNLKQADRGNKQLVGGYIRALGFSGEAKYLPTLQSFVDSPTYKRFAIAAIADQSNYERWNPIISNRATFDPKYSDEVNRIRNMLQSNDLGLNEIGAKRVYFANKDDVLLELLAANIRGSYRDEDPDNADPIAWMVKALGSAKNPKYQPLMEEVSNEGGSSKIRKYAAKNY